MTDSSYTAHHGDLEDLHGTTGTVAVFTSLYLPTVDDPDLDAIDGNEVDVADAPGYERAAVTIAWDGQDITVTVPPTFDFDDFDDVAHFVLAAADGSLVGRISYSEGWAPGDGFTVPDVSYAGVRDAAGLAGRVTALEEAPGSPVPDPTSQPDGKTLTTAGGALIYTDPPTGGGSVPDPAGGTDGQVPTVDGGVYVLATPSGGGGGGSPAAPIDATADAGPTVTLDMSGLTGASSVLVYLADTATEVAFSDLDTALAAIAVILYFSGPVVGVDVKPNGSGNSVPVTGTAIGLTFHAFDTGGDIQWLPATEPRVIVP